MWMQMVCLSEAAHIRELRFRVDPAKGFQLSRIISSQHAGGCVPDEQSFRLVASRSKTKLTDKLVQIIGPLAASAHGPGALRILK